MRKNSQDTIGIGAGAAGLEWGGGPAAAGLVCVRVLAVAGHRVQVLEARDRIGGRIFTVMDGAEPIELGPEFVHGEPPVTLQLLREAKLETYAMEGEHLCSDAQGVRHCDRSYGESFEYLEELAKYDGPDQSFAAWIAQ